MTIYFYRFIVTSTIIFFSTISFSNNIILMIEALSGGLEELALAAEKFDVDIHLLTYDKSMYDNQVKRIKNKRLKIIDGFERANAKQIIDYFDRNENIIGMINATDGLCLTSLEVSKARNIQVGQSPEAVKLVRDKSQLRKRLIEKKLSSGFSERLNRNDILAILGGERQDLLESFNYPLMLKDNSGSGSNYARKVNSRDELFLQFEYIMQSSIKDKDFVIEKFFTGLLFSAETVSFDGLHRVYSLTSRVLDRFNNEIVWSLPFDKEALPLNGIDEFIGKVLNEIEWEKGLAHIEFIVTDNGFEIVEINPRVAGAFNGQATSRAFGINIYEAFIELALDKSPSLLDTDMDIKKYAAIGSIRSLETGYFKEIFMDNISNDFEVKVTAKEGKKIDNLNSDNATVGYLVHYSAVSSEMALLSLMDKLRHISVRVTNIK